MSLPLGFEEYFTEKQFKILLIYYLSEFRAQFLNHIKKLYNETICKDPFVIGKEFYLKHEMFYYQIYKLYDNPILPHYHAEKAILDFYPNFNTELDECKRKRLIIQVASWANLMMENNL